MKQNNFKTIKKITVMKATHSSSFLFKEIDPTKYSRFGDFGEGFYCYVGEYCAYGIHKGQHIYTLELASEKIIDLNPMSRKDSFDFIKDNNLLNFECNYDAIIVGKVLIVKSNGLSKLKIINQTNISEVITDNYGLAEMFSCENGKVYIV